MKKYLITVTIIILLFVGADAAYYRFGWYIDLHPDRNVSCSVTTENRTVLLDSGNGPESFEIRGVDMGSGIPGKWSTDFAADKETYLRWFGQIQAMGANTVRIYTVHSEDFYEAFFEYNLLREEPLYLLQGVWVDEYSQFSHLDGWSKEFCETFLSDCRRAVDVIHGRRKIREAESKNAGSGNYRRDISPWVLGYIIGVEWEGDVTALTNDKYRDDPERNSFSGQYLQTTADATPFEAMLAYVGDGMIAYETGKYKTQRLLAFSNWPATDPFEYPLGIQEELHKDVSIDVEHIAATERWHSGQFASYHVYPYYPCFINYMDDWSIYGIESKLDYLRDDGVHSYEAYLHGLVNHHQMPVIISEFGIPASRGMASRDVRTGRNQGYMTEAQQGEALAACYEDIMAAGCAGSCLFSWQDEWFKRAWNTLHAVDMKRNPFWSDYQTNEQAFGVLTFDPGEEESVCLPDKKSDEWKTETPVAEGEGYRLYMKYDEKFIYLMVEGEGDLSEKKLYVPIDTTERSGSSYCEGEDLRFDRAADFLLVLNGEGESRLLVQERYDAVRSTFSRTMYGYDTYLQKNIPDRDSPKFVKIMFPLQEPTLLVYGEGSALQAQYETGKLTLGNADPEADDFNSLTDFCYGDGFVEVRLPWQLLNFSDPSRMEIHDDYYDNYGVAYRTVSKIWLGIGEKAENRIRLSSAPLSGWGNSVDARERLKESYYAMQEIWTCDAETENSRASSQAEKARTNEVTISVESEVPVLMYHDFGNHREACEEGWEDLLGEYAVWDDEFEEDLRYLKENGYTAITCEQLKQARNNEGELPEKPVLITIDDGRYGVYANAWPLLKKYGMTASLAVVGKQIDGETSQGAEYREYLFCTWTEIAEMEDSGAIEVISHTYGFHQEENEELKEGASLDIGVEKEALETAATDYIHVQDTLMRRIGRRTDILSYPYSVRNSDSDRIWAETGYRMFLCGTPDTVKESLEYTYTSERVKQSVICLVPRMPRMHGNSIDYYLEKYTKAMETAVSNGTGR